MAEHFEPAIAICDEIRARRAQQITKGYDAAHDDGHANGEIAMAASAYAAAGKHSPTGTALWPWSIDQFHPKNARSNLIDAAALCVAEIERIDRARAAIANATMTEQAEEQSPLPRETA